MASGVVTTTPRAVRAESSLSKSRVMLRIFLTVRSKVKVWMRLLITRVNRERMMPRVNSSSADGTTYTTHNTHTHTRPHACDLGALLRAGLSTELSMHLRDERLAV